MKIPKRIIIRGKVWATRYRVKPMMDGVEVLGYVDADKRLIYLKKSLSSDELKKLFIHELIHAICSEYEMHVTSLTPDVEELLCQLIAGYVCQLIDK